MQMRVILLVYPKLVDKDINKNKVVMVDLIQKKRKREIEQFFHFYFRAVHIRQLFFTYPFLTQNILGVLNHLEKQGIISGYHILNVQRVKVFLHYDVSRNIPLIQNIMFFSSRGRKRFISAQTLKSFVQHYPNSFVLIGTKYGILNLSQCQKLNCGGKLILSII
jgi:ribosomal protein S8